MSSITLPAASNASTGNGLGRTLTVAGADLGALVRRPLFWIWASVLVLVAFGMSTGSMRIQSGDTAVGGTKAWITSEFAIAQQLSMLSLLFYAFFLAILAGMAIIQDAEWRVGELIHATPLRPGEYIWGKFAAVMAGTLAILAIHLLAMAFFFHLWPVAAQKGIRGPFDALNYLRPAAVFLVPMLVFLAGTSLAAGELTRRAIVVFLIPLAILSLDAFFLWSWSPGWLSPAVNRALMLVEPTGFRWLQETWLKVDRGVGFYNTARIPYDVGFLASRLAMIVLGLGSVILARRHFARTLSGRLTSPSRRARLTEAPEGQPAAPARGPIEQGAGRLASLAMTGGRPGLLAGTWHVARIELAELIASPGLYLFVPLILLQVLGNSLARVGYLDTPLLITPGGFAIGTMGQLSVLVGLLLLWYGVEALERERSTRLAAISDIAPIRTGSLLLGKATALAAVGLAVVLAAALGGLLALAIQGKVPFEAGPLVLVWGLLLFPTLLLWTAFVFAVRTVTRNRYTTYAVGLAVLCFTGYQLLVDEINWVGNWPLWDAVRWSDLSVLELDRPAIVLSRLLAVSLACFLLAVTVRFFPRREPDPIRVVHRLRPASLLSAGLRLAPWAIAPMVCGTWLAIEIGRGHQGHAAKEAARDYWRKNLATYRDVPLPDLTHVDLDVELFPDTGRFRVSGSYDLVNPHDAPLRQWPLTPGARWEGLTWTLDGQPCTPEDRAGLKIFKTPEPLKKGQTARVGFRYEAQAPRGISRRGGGLGEFVVPSAVVLTSFGPGFVPMLGYSEQIGVEDENRHEPREFPEDFYLSSTESMLGARAPFTTRIALGGPADFTLNSVGIKVSDTREGDRRKVVWQSDQPVSFFNVVAGRLLEKKGKGTAVYYHPRHAYNVDEILSALDAARTYFSEWFHPYPWSELKLTEFPDLASYAQGFPTNISFSEGVGFLTADSPEIHFAFEITSHEAAHQWWGNIVVPGKGPGGNILSEGMAHFSTILLVEQVKGLRSRIDFCKRIEAKYADGRHRDAERPLVKIDGSRPGDTTVTYDKGGWVFWMLLNHMGRERTLEGLQSFIKKYRGNPDHPVLQDFLAEMRPFAEDPAAFDAFTRAWFLEVVVPEYRLANATRVRDGDGWKVVATLKNEGTGAPPVAVAATRGERFGKEGGESPDYREARATATVAAGQSQELTIRCPFEPEAIVVDPDALVLQLQRKSAVHRF